MSSVIEQWCNTIEILRRGERDEFLELLSSTEAPSVAMLKDCASRVLLESAGEGTLVARFEGLFGLAMEAASEAPGLSVHVLEQGLTTQAVSHWGELLEVVFRRHAGFAALCARDDVRRGLLSVFRECLRLLSPVLHSLLRSRFLLLLALLFEQPAAASSISAAVVTMTAPPSQRHEPSLISRTLPCRRLPSSGLATPSEGDRGRFEAFWNLQETYFHAQLLSPSPTQLQEFDRLVTRVTSHEGSWPPQEPVLKAEYLFHPWTCASPSSFAAFLPSLSFQRLLLVQALIYLSSLSLSSPDASAAIALARATEQRLVQLLKDLDAQDSPTMPSYSALLLSLLWADRASRTHPAQEGFRIPPLAPQHPRPSLSRKRPPAAAAADPCQGAAKKQHSLGNRVLDQLWNTERPPLEHPSRDYLPRAQAFLLPLVEQLDPAAGIEDEYLLSNDNVFVWRASRCLIRDDLPHFVRCQGNLSEAALDLFPEQKQRYAELRAQKQREDQELDDIFNLEPKKDLSDDLDAIITTPTLTASIGSAVLESEEPTDLG
ncbi:MAG: hypothetical protein Q8P67_03045, partial [archaeon]|nr:hypothetical protein [archaeon]